MFLDNVYTKEYYNIIEKNRKKTQGLSIRKIKSQCGYTEKHHIIPKSLGGKDKKENMVYMPESDHFRCHQLLVEMTTGVNHGKMWKALFRMMNKQSKNQHRDFNFLPEEYEQARINAAKSQSERFSGENNHFYNKKHSVETLTTMSLAKKGKSYEEIFGIEEAKIMRDRRSKEQQGKIRGKQKIVKCDYCEKEGGAGIMNRWHGVRCKNYNISI
jgi:hypothetical protein